MQMSGVNLPSVKMGITVSIAILVLNSSSILRFTNLQSAMTSAKQVTARGVHFVHLHMLKISCASSPTVMSSSGSCSSLSPIGPLCRQRSLANGALCSECSTSGVSSPNSSYPKAPGFEREDQVKQKSLPADNYQKISEQDNKQNHLSVFSVVNPLASSITSSITSSLASSIGSDNSSPTALSAISAKALPFYPGSNTVESVIGSALDLHFSDINVASLDKELEDQENSDLGLTSQRLLGSSAPVNIPGSVARSSSLHSSSSLSTSPLSSLSQSLSQSFISSTMAPHQQQTQPLKSEHSMLGTSASSHNSLGVTGSIWDFITGSFSPSPSPILNSGTMPSTNSNASGSELAHVRQELDDANRKIKQWDDSWQQVKQACDAWQKEAQEAKERAKVADADKKLALRKKEDLENKLKKLQEQFDMCLSTTVLHMKSYGDIKKIPLPKLHSLQNQLRLDLETVDGVIFQLHSKKCVVCQEHDRSVILKPCQHYVLCEHCAAKQECPCCKMKKRNGSNPSWRKLTCWRSRCSTWRACNRATPWVTTPWHPVVSHGLVRIHLGEGSVCPNATQKEGLSGMHSLAPRGLLWVT
ncbi:putative E3 ubiquitin-protein ligase UNKL isoform X3 [Caretta caretta]|uniref:putative E3 ubiquitin-protein ligase UNKL isoform X3 n=1 Tax=Caretta caretta TaxID=8467 RepID=UPI003F4C5870